METESLTDLQCRVPDFLLLYNSMATVIDFCKCTGTVHGHRTDQSTPADSTDDIQTQVLIYTSDRAQNKSYSVMVIQMLITICTEPCQVHEHSHELSELNLRSHETQLKPGKRNCGIKKKRIL